MITVYGRVTSSNVQAVLWGMAELGLEHERLDYGHVFGGLNTPEFRALNPHELIPVIRDGEVVVWESCAILRYLASHYGDGGAFWPANPAQRAVVDMWAEWGKISFAQNFTAPIFWSRVRTAAVDRDEAALSAAIAHFETRIEALENQLENINHLLIRVFLNATLLVPYQAGGQPKLKFTFSRFFSNRFYHALAHHMKLAFAQRSLQAQ